jgi:NAD(P)H-hydrate epimerase
MDRHAFETPDGRSVPAVTAVEMREVDRIAVEEVGLTLRRMMEHAGRSLALEALETDDLRPDGSVVVIVGGGGNGGGGLVCARHLANRAIPTTVVLDRDPREMEGVPGEQLDILDHIDHAHVRTNTPDTTPTLVVDSLLGYGLDGAPRGTAETLIEWVGTLDTSVLSLDVPSGMDATTGETPGVALTPERTLTLALPKTGLTALTGELRLADLSIPATVYDQLDIPVETLFGSTFRVRLSVSQ